ncbi:MAG TPA: metallophosphoesterase family protein [Burkholderiaceae bacterium]|nr:metallophosphoesterase family protein [Burkholderiaceae bacterium]
MRLNVLSDLHLSRGELPLPDTDADLVILAGDLGRPAEAFAWARRFDRPVLYVPGNHEFYGGEMSAVLDEMRALCAGSTIRVLDRNEAIVDGVRFLGATLWTDFMLFGDGAARADAMRVAQRFSRDFSRIVVEDGEHSTRPFTPEDSALLFERAARWLDERLAMAHTGPTVVITHHAPSPRSIHPRFAGSPINAAFVSQAEHLMGGDRVRLWVHGHTHDSFDYRVDGTRIVCNPRGYARDGVNENPAFDAKLVVEID